METSARNVFHGKVVAVRSGAVNDEVELSVEGGQSIVASITQTSTKKLGLKPGVEAMAPDQGQLRSADERRRGLSAFHP